MSRKLPAPLLIVLALAITLSACATATPTAVPTKPAPPPAAPTAAAPAAAPTTAPTAVPTAAPAATKPAAPSPTTAPAAPTATTAAAAPSPTTATAAKPAAALKVGLVTDVGKIDDKSFNQSAWEGVQRTQRELNAQIKFIETTDPKDYAKNIDQFGQDNYDVVVTVGFALGQATGEAAKKYPKVKFIGVDQFQEKDIENVAGLIFPEDKAGYLAGYLAGSMTKSKVVGQVLGTPIVPPVEAFGVGYIAGVKAANKDAKILSACHPGGLAKGFTDPDWGKSTTIQMIDQKADVVFAAGGLTGNGGLIAAAERKIMGIGVDTDQYNTLPEARSALLSSAMKLITPGVFNLVKSVQDGKFKGGNVVGEVGLAGFHDFEDKVPADLKAKLREIDQSLRTDAIKTGWGRPTGNCPQP